MRFTLPLNILLLAIFGTEAYVPNYSTSTFKSHLRAKTCMQLQSSPESTPSQTQNGITFPTPKEIASTLIAGSIFCSTIFLNGDTIISNIQQDTKTSPIEHTENIFHPPQASAAVAPLADVGLREFLVKDGKQFLRLGLPTSLPTATDPTKLGDTGRVVQESTELVRLRLEQVGFSGKTPVWNAALKDANTAKSLISTPEMIEGIKGKAQQEKAKVLVEQAKDKLDELALAIRSQDITSTLARQEEAGAFIGQIRALSLKQGELPYKIPSDYDNLPRLRGRATVTCSLAKSSNSKKPYYTLEDGSRVKEVQLKLVIDGFHAPITGGNFVDLVQRKFYNDMPIQGVGDLLVSTGKPPGGASNGFVDPSTKQKRTIPLELFYKKDKAPTYEYTSDDEMRATESFTLPFQAYGALGMDYVIEEEEGVNSGSSEFWFLKWDQGLLAPGRNTLDGSHSCFGYVVEGADVLGQVEVGDKIEYMKVEEGLENFFPKA